MQKSKVPVKERTFILDQKGARKMFIGVLIKWKQRSYRKNIQERK